MTTLLTDTTAPGRELVVKRLVRDEMRWFSGNSQTRKWEPKTIHYRGQMQKLAPALRRGEAERVKALVEGSLAIELREPDYVKEGLRAAGNDQDLQTFYRELWGPQEENHWVALQLCLIDSDLMTPDQVAEYSHECREGTEAKRWNFRDQTGYGGDDPVFPAAYALAQESHTRQTYAGIRMVVREEYDNPLNPYQGTLDAGMCGVLRLIERDEGAHQAMFLRLMRIYLRYWTDRALDALCTVYKAYNMPVVHIPNAEQFLSALMEAELYGAPFVYREVVAPALRSLGVNGRKEAARAADNFRGLLAYPNVVVQLPGEPLKEVPEGCTVQELRRDGSFVEVPQAA